MGPEIEPDSIYDELESDDQKDGGIGEKLRNIERDSLVSMETARKAGLGLMGGSALYINEQSKDIMDAIEDSVPGDFSAEQHVPEEAQELAGEVGAFLDEGAESLEEAVDWSQLPAYLGLEGYESELEESATEAEPVVDEVVEKLNTNVTSWEEMGIDPSGDVVEQLGPETAADALLYSFDNLMHLAITGAASNFAAQAADRYTDKEFLIAAAGMSTALVYHVAKEGFYEGGAGLQFNYENLDVQGDVMANFFGALWGTSSYLYSRGKEQAVEGERDTGLHGAAARKAGRAYEKAKYLAGESSAVPFLQYDLPEAEDREVPSIKYDLGQNIGTGDD